MEKERLFEIFKDTEAICNDAVMGELNKLTGDDIHCPKAFQWAQFCEEIAREIANRFRNKEIHAVMSSTFGGMLLSYEVGKLLDARIVFAENEGGYMRFKDGFEVAPGSKVLIIDDVVENGEMLKKMMQLVISEGGTPMGAGCIFDLSDGALDIGMEIQSIVKKRTEIKKFNLTSIVAC